MSGLEKTTMIHLLSADTAYSQSQESILRQQALPVNILDIDDHHVANNLNCKDLVVIDMDSEHPAIFEIADKFMRSSSGPKLLLTSQQDRQFKPNDSFVRDGVFLLFKPYQTHEFLEKISIIS